MRLRATAALLASVPALLVAACNDKGTLDRSRVEMIRVDGRRFEVRLAATDTPDVWRLLVVRGTLVINPDPDTERDRAWTVARQIMDRTCRGRPYTVLEDNLVDNVNHFTTFRCTS